MPSSATDQRLVSPVSSQPLVPPSPLERGGPSPWVRLLPPGKMARAYCAPQPSLPSSRYRREFPFPRDRGHCPPTAPLWPWSPSGEWRPGGLGPGHMALPAGHRHKKQKTESISHAQLLSVALAQAAHHQASSSHPWQQSATLVKGPHPNSPPKAHHSQPRK